MPINNSYNEDAIVEAIATSLDNFYTNLISNIDKLNIKKVMKRKNPYLFRADSRKKQEQNFVAASKLAQQAKKRFVPIVGYGYGKKKASNRGIPKFYMELAGKDFWTELTGDEEFYIKLIRFMDKLPEKYVEEFDTSYQKAANRFVREFTREFCCEDGSIDWEKLVEFNSGN